MLIKLGFENDTPNWTRLDDLHQEIHHFLGNKLFYGEKEIEPTPKRILDAGAGSAGWAIEAAHKFPEAEVFAVDLSPTLLRPLPKNVKYMTVNMVTEELPFESGSFDLIHCRFVIVHIRDFPQLLNKLAKLLRPGGWLLILDNEHNMKGDIGPGIKKFYDTYHKFTKPYGVDPLGGPKLEETLKDMGVFSEVNVRKVEAPFDGVHEDRSIGRLGKALRKSISGAYEVLNPRLVESGLNEKIRKGWYEDVEDPKRRIHTDLYFTWSKKA
ncbi:hypothetical protein M422DRAFT_239222 [Sphaerobolus stellatus SS14]|nr:hypothetical protein M422DRAFT_239222 [Sphaerobolus stellatus SS14]